MIVLDTHTWFWYVTEHPRIPRSAKAAMVAQDALGLSPISLWEIGMLAKRGRIHLDRSPLKWLRYATTFPKIQVLPITRKSPWRVPRCRFRMAIPPTG